MVTIIGLHDALCDFLQTKVAPGFGLKNLSFDGTQSYKEPQVIRSGWILPRSIDEGSADMYEEFPYIMPRIGKVENIKNERESIVEINIFFGVYDPGVYDENGVLVNDGSGYRDFWNLVETTRLALFQAQVIDNRYSIVADFFEAEIFEVQEYPYWEGYCQTKWRIIYPQTQLEEFFYK